MKLRKLCLGLFCCLFSGAFAQTILNEDFESGAVSPDAKEESYIDTNMPSGWTVISAYKGNTAKYKWHNEWRKKGMLAGKHSAVCDAASSFSTVDDKSAYGPKEEILLTPELDLNDTYELSFLWEAASHGVLEVKEYDMEVRVVEAGADPKTAPSIFCLTDKLQVNESGVPNFPWTGWTVYKSSVDLSKYKGKKVKIAFVHKMLKKGANILFIDDVTVKRVAAVTSPIAQLSNSTYNFGNVYVGSKTYSEVLTLKNIGLAGLKVLSVEAPAGVETTLDPQSIDLGKNATVDFQVSYKAALTTAAKGVVVIKTNGGDVQLQYNATKIAITDNGMFEGFENGVPPTGWTANSGWKATKSAIEGDFSAYTSGSLGEESYLISPRLDLSKGKHSLNFTFFNEYYSEDGSQVSDSEFKVALSVDGGKTWVTKFLINSENGFNQINDVNIDLGQPGSDNCYIKWVANPLSYGEEGLMSDPSVLFIDKVVLPSLYGIGKAPEATQCTSPLNGEENVFNKDVVLKWEQVLLADGYKLFVGTDAAATNILNGKDLKEATSYQLGDCKYATKYYWKVVPYNANGEAQNAPVWSFTILPDQTISQFPYFEGFENEELPLGWRSERTENGSKWGTNNTQPFDGKYSVSVYSRAVNENIILQTPDFKLDAAKDASMSFYWGNGMSIALEIDETSQIQNTNKVPDGIDVCYFEISVDGKWNQLAILSDKTKMYWMRERIDLSAYKGKTVSFRWRYTAQNYMDATGVSLDNLSVEYTEKVKTAFNFKLWDAGNVNYNETVKSGNSFTLYNEGSETLEIESVEFATKNFSTTLKAGDKIAFQKSINFELSFNASDNATLVEDNMVVKFVGGGSATLPVKGNALAADIKYYSFEEDTPGVQAPKGFTMIDVDKKATLNLTAMDFPGYGQAFAYSVQDDKTWRNMLKPVSGSKALVALTPDNSTYTSDDWIISSKMMATAQSNFKFHARNWESVNSIMPGSCSSIEVLVSTTDATDTKNFETVMESTQLPLYNGNSYEVYDVDLSKYAGKEIYVALRHTVNSGLGAFFDDFYFEHFTFNAGVENVFGDAEVEVYPNPATSVLKVRGVENANISVYNMSGAEVLNAENTNEINVEELTSGIFFVKVIENDKSFVTRFVKK